MSPAVRKIVVENKIDIQSVKGSGKDGRILKGDLISLMGAQPQPSERKIQYGPEEKIRMTRLRQTIAKRLKQAQENAALLTTFNEVDMSSIMEMRKENQEDFQSRYGIKLGFMSFFVKACIVALKSFPAVNAEIDGEDIIYKNEEGNDIFLPSGSAIAAGVILESVESESLRELTHATVSVFCG